MRGILCIAPNSYLHSNAVMNYAIAIRLFRTVLRIRFKNFSRDDGKGTLFDTEKALLFHIKVPELN